MIEYVKRNDLGLTDFEIVMCGGDYKEALKMLLDKIEKAPAADVMEVRHAYKIDITATKDFFSWYKCSACGYNGLFLEDKYCSCCGVKLDGGQEDGKIY